MKIDVTIPLSDGAVAKLPFPLSAEDYDVLIATLELWKSKFIKHDPLEVSPAPK